jgi:hypothetical protein
VCVVVARVVTTTGTGPLERALESRVAPVVCGLLSAVLAWSMFGTLDEPAGFHDEAAYLLQAQLLSRGQVTGPGAPLPEFFHQYHVLVEPRLAPKYPPGHPVWLTPGVAIGLPGLMPVVSAGLSGALVFALGRSCGNVWIGALSWLLWSTGAGGLCWRASYFSQTTSGLAWLGACLALHRWLRHGGRRWMSLLAALLGWLAITRPLSALALAIPFAAVVIVVALRRRRHADVLVGLAAGAVVLALLPTWNAATTGDWRLPGHFVYARDYIPWDRIGFGLDSTPPRVELPPEMSEFVERFEHLHAAHTVERLPALLWERLPEYGRATLGSPTRVVITPLLLVGAVAVPGAGLFCLGSIASLAAAYLFYAHHLGWDVYYYEGQAALAFLAAAGLWAVMTWASTGRFPRGLDTPARAALASALLLVTLGLVAVIEVDAVRQDWSARTRYFKAAQTLFGRIPEAKAIVFVRYGPEHTADSSLVVNPPDYDDARLWVVHDRGADNERLRALAPQRAGYVFDEASWSLWRLPPASVAP